MFHRTGMMDKLIPGQAVQEVFDSLPPAAPGVIPRHLNRTTGDLETVQSPTNLSPPPVEGTAPDYPNI
jgi:hypothetical protein